MTSPLRSPAAYLSRHVASSSRSSLASSSNTTKLSNTSIAQDANPEAIEDNRPSEGQLQESKKADGSQIPEIKPVETEQLATDPSGQSGETVPKIQDSNGSDTGGWLAWFSKSGTIVKDDPPNSNAKVLQDQAPAPTSTQNTPIAPEESKSDSMQVNSEVSQEQRQSWLAYLYTAPKVRASLKLFRNTFDFSFTPRNAYSCALV